MVLKMVDGGIVDIETENYCKDFGCETCGYGSIYTNYIKFILTKNTLTIEVDKEYDYAFSEGFLITYFASNASKFASFTEGEFISYLKNNFRQAVVDYVYPIEKKDTMFCYEWCKEIFEENLKISFEIDQFSEKIFSEKFL